MKFNLDPGRPNMLATSSGSTSNVTINDVIGNKNDEHNILSAMGYLDALYEHMHSVSNFHPSLAANITLTAGATAFSLGANTTIVSSGTITSDFDIHFVHATNASASGTYVVYLYQGSSGLETKIAETRFTRAVGLGDVSPVITISPLIAANVRISAAVATSTSGAATIDVALGYHTY